MSDPQLAVRLQHRLQHSIRQVYLLASWLRLHRHPFAYQRVAGLSTEGTNEQSIMPSRAQDWFRQAERDLEQAADSQAAGRHEWACFAAQQGAEKAVEALHLSRGQEAWGHVIAKLLQELPETVAVPDALIEQGRVLDNYYIPARYPNSHPEGPPFEHFGPLQSTTALDYARTILAFVRTQMA